jgi:hypothetical protein
MPSGPCEPWTIDDSCSDIPDGTPQEVIDRWQAVSTELLWAASGRRYGLCEVTVRPCLRRCGGYGFGFYEAFGSYPFLAFPDGEGTWFNIATCGCGDTCSCTALSEVVLGGPVDSVMSVDVGTETLDADQYRLDLVGGQYRLLRVDGGVWPSCQDFTAACGDDGSFCVTYQQGLALDDLAIAANSELTSELIKACDESCKTCRLPKNATVVVRRGVTITMDLAKAWLQALPVVSAFLSAVNPNGLMASPGISTPDLPKTRTTVGPLIS